MPTCLGPILGKVGGTYSYRCVHHCWPVQTHGERIHGIYRKILSEISPKKYAAWVILAQMRKCYEDASLNNFGWCELELTGAKVQYRSFVNTVMNVTLTCALLPWLCTLCHAVHYVHCVMQYIMCTVSCCTLCTVCHSVHYVHYVMLYIMYSMSFSTLCTLCHVQL